MNRNISWVVVLTSILVLLLLSACQPGQTDEDPPRAEEIARRIENVESGLRQAVITEGRDSRFTLAERMAHYNVPGVSIAVINNGRIEWARGYGVLEAGGDEPVTTETMFQAASISKPVAAVGALSLVESGALTLDADVNDYLTSWKVPQSEFTVEQPLTLAHLLSHSGGVTVHGFRGYAHDEQVPTLTQLLDGQAPANSDPIRVDTKPGDLWRYSGGGFCIVQQMMIDASGKPFPELMQEFVLGALGMEHSTYEQPLPERLSASAARGHRPDGQLVPGRWHTYPEMAAAGLWTTPSDLARFAIDVINTFEGKSAAVLSRDRVIEMLTVQHGNYGLGLSIGFFLRTQDTLANTASGNNFSKGFVRINV